MVSFIVTLSILLLFALGCYSVAALFIYVYDCIECIVERKKRIKAMRKNEYQKYLEPAEYGSCSITFIVNASGTRIKRNFPSPYFAKQFYEKAKRSKDITLVAYPNFQ